MKKIIMTVISLFMTVCLVITTFAASSPYVIEGGMFLGRDTSVTGIPNIFRAKRADYPEYVRGYWWRDPSNQNELAEHTATEFGNQVQLVYDSRLVEVYVWTSQFESNVILFRTGETNGGDIINNKFLIVGTGGSSIAAAAAKAAFAEVIPEFQIERISGIVYTDTDASSYSGVSEFIPAGASVPVYADSSFIPSVQKETAVREARLARTSKMQGWNLTWGPDGYLGMGSGYEPAKSNPVLEVLPTVIINESTSVIMNRVPFIFKPTGENGLLSIWIPGHKILCLGSPFGKYFPDVAPLNGKTISTDTAIDMLNQSAANSPNFLLLLHGQPVTDNQTCLTMLNDQMNALNYVRTETLQKANLGYSIDDITASIKLPDDIAGSPYVKEFTTTVASAARALYAEYFGWFDGNVTGLGLSSDLSEAECMSDLAGGPKLLLWKAKEALISNDINDIQKALVMSNAVLLVRPSSEATEVYIMALKKLAYCQTSAQMRNYYLSEAEIAGN